MATARRTRTAGRRLRIGGGVFFLLLGTLLFAAQEKPAGENRAAPAKQGIVVTVPLPLVGEVDEQVRATIDRLLDDAPPKAAGERPLLVLEFRQDSNSEAGQSGFERGLALAGRAAAGSGGNCGLASGECHRPRGAAGAGL